MEKITIIAFNYGNAGNYVNGPGMCLVNFVKILKRSVPNIEINVFSEMRSSFSCKSLYSEKKVFESIEHSDVVHHWSGMGEQYVKYLRHAKGLRKKIIVGPNVIDTVYKDKERSFLSCIEFDKLLTVNERLRYLISKEHNLSPQKIEVLMVGPDLELWKSIPVDNGKILWKGNSKQFVKDVEFGLKVRKALPQYEFEFIGYPSPYDYRNHIRTAKACHLYICTSLSETMSMCLSEQLIAGVPSVTHPKIYLHGENYKTGIITSRTVKDYCEAIEEIMENDLLWKQLSEGAASFARYIFSDKKVFANYLSIVS